MSLRIFRLGVGVFLLLSGCAPQREASPAVSISAQEFLRQRVENAGKRQCAEGSAGVGILSGQKLADSSRIAQSLVLLQSESLKGQGMSCTGTRISKHVILTAAHCFDSETTNAYAIIGTDPFCDASKRQLKIVRVKSIIRHEDFIANQKFIIAKAKDENRQFINGKMAQSDLALVEIEASDYDFEIMKIGKELSPKSKNPQMNYYSAGFGATTGLQTPDPLDPMLRFAAVEIKTSYTAGDRQQLQLSGISDLDLKHFIMLNQTTGAGVCSGDSGGPLLQEVNGTLQIQGVASFVFSSRSDVDPCSYAGVYVRLSQHHAWLKKTFRKFGLPDRNPF